MMRVMLMISALALWPTISAAEQVRSSALRVVDGDTVAIGKTRYRLVGFDTPETYYAKCDYEKALGDAATGRVRQLIKAARVVEFVVQPGRDKYDRGLARIFIGGNDIGSILISEGLARPYHGGRRQGWCG